MIWSFLCTPLFSLAGAIISLIPYRDNVTGVIASKFYEFMGWGLYFCGSDIFILILVNVLSWISIDLIWAVVEFCYKKLPFISG